MEQNYQQQQLTQPKNWLVESILVTIFCCQIFGIVSIVFAAQVNSKFAQGDYEGALRASKDAERWTKISFWLGIATIILSALWIFFWVGFGVFTSGFRNH